ncbi:MAG: NAD(P)H-hydrate epimerase, partial [Albidovulum sp.]
MTELLTAAQMRAIEQAAIASGEVTGLELMERAGRGVVEAIFEEWPEFQAGSFRAVVLCGPGNNGGDGFVVARLLKEWGWEVEVFLYGDPERLPPDARVNYERWCGMGEVRKLDCEEFWLDPATTSSDTIIVDAIFGIGLSRPFDCNAVSWALLTCSLNCGEDSQHWPSARVVAVDVPSGLDADSGEFLRPDSIPFDFELASANLTVTFHGMKTGHAIGAGPDHCGKVVVKDIGLPPAPRGASAPLRPRPAP